MNRFWIVPFVVLISACTGSNTADVVDAGIDATSDAHDAGDVKQGTIILQVTGGFSAAIRSSAYAFFGTGPVSDNSFLDPGSPCVITRRVEPIDAGVVDAGSDAGVPVAESAGPIHIEGGAAPATLTFDGTRYSRFDMDGEAWNGGSNIVVSADGAQTPAFTQSIPFPRHGNWITPMADTSGIVAISRSEPLNLQWQPTEGIIEVRLGFSNVGVGEVTEVRCAFDAVAGSGVIGTATLQMVSTTDVAAMRYASFDVAGITRSRFTAGDRAMVLEALTFVYHGGAMTF